MARVDIQKSNDVILRDFNLRGQEISDIEVHCPYGGLWQIFLIAEDKNGLTEIIEFTSIDNCYYYPSLDDAVRINPDEEVTCKFLFLNCSTRAHFYSKTFRAKLISKQFELARQVYLVKQFGSNIENYYKCIVQLLERLLEEKGEKE